jgi:hypothetical protein
MPVLARGPGCTRKQLWALRVGVPVGGHAHTSPLQEAPSARLAVSGSAGVPARATVRAGVPPGAPGTAPATGHEDNRT